MTGKGYKIELESEGRSSKLHARDFSEIISTLKSHQSGHVSIVRKRDNFEIYCGPLDQARWKFGLGSNIKYRGNV